MENWAFIPAICLPGMGGVPALNVVDSDFGGNRTPYMVHDHDGRDLHLETAEKTLAYVHRLW